MTRAIANGWIAQLAKSHLLPILVSTGFLITSFGTVGAQERSAPIDPQQIEKQLRSRDLERSRVQRDIPQAPTLKRRSGGASTAPLLVLTEVTIDGARAVDQYALRDAYTPYIGRTMSQADLEDMAGAISEKYRAAGYHLSRALILPQDVRNGAIRVRVVEGAISEIKVIGDPGDRFGVNATLSDLLQERPSQLSSLERKLLIVSDTPGLKVVDTGIDEISEASGSFRLTIKVDTWRVYASLGVDNSGTRAVGPFQSYASTSFNSYLISGDALGLNASTVPNATRDLREGRVSYDTPVGRDGLKLGVSGSYSEVWPDDNRRAVETRIANQTYSLRGSYSPVQTRALTINLFSALSYTDETERNDFGTVYKDHVRALRAGIDIRAQDPFNGSNYATAALRRGLNVFNATQANDLFSSQWDAGPNFSIFEYAYTRYQQFNDSFSVKATIAGQVAFNPLFSSQKFYLGAAGFGPGYYSGDNGVSGLAELRFDKAVSTNWLKNLQLYAFIDGGAAWDHNSAKQGISSVGPGLRVTLFDNLYAGIAYAVPIAQTSRTDEYRASRLLFNLSTSLKFCPDRAEMRCFSGSNN